MKIGKNLTFMAVLAIFGITVVFTACGDKGDPSSPSHTHQWGEWTVTRAPTCTTEGERTRKCALDGTTETETIPVDLVNGHDYRYIEGSGTPPTCEDDGEGDEVCSHNPSHTRSGAISKLGHDWDWVVTTAATFITEGEETRVCSHDATHTETRTIDPLLITTTADWTTALSQLNGKTGSYTLNINGNIGVAGISISAYSFGTTSTDGLIVTLKGSGKLYLTSKGNIFCIRANQTLIIDSETLTLEGLTSGNNGATGNNEGSVIYIDGGTLELKNGLITGNTADLFGAAGVWMSLNSTFTMYDGGKISGNISNNWSVCGGVNVQGTFIMNGGEISGNTAGGGNIDNKGGGGGVYVALDGTFTMNGGKISNNTTSGEYSYGGGVYIGGTFTMTNGEIFNNSSGNGGGGVYVGYRSAYFFGTFRFANGTIYGSDNAELSNTAPNGAALFVEDGSIAQRGTLIGGWTSSGDLTTTDDTIN